MIWRGKHGNMPDDEPKMDALCWGRLRVEIPIASVLTREYIARFIRQLRRFCPHFFLRFL